VTRRSGRDSGAAVVEFTLVSVVLVTLFLAVLQLGFVIHVRNTLVACAAEGARHAANADLGLADGRERTEALISDSLSASLAGDVRAAAVVVDGVAMVEITVTTTLPLVGMLGIDRGLTVSGHAVEESGL
jgi:hypothetical protein